MTFACNICGKNFTTNQYCQIHWLNIHGNQKGFKCDQCESSFPDQKALNNHKKYVHKPKDVECKFCNKHLKTERNLKIHIQDVHETNDPKTRLWNEPRQMITIQERHAIPHKKKNILEEMSIKTYIYR